MANPHGTPIWYELQTLDPDTSTVFYDAVVGWAIEGRPAGDMDYRMIVAADGGNAGGVTPINAAIPGAATEPGWLMYLGVDDVDATAAAIGEAGGSIAMGPLDLEGVGRFAKVADPQGVPFYIMRGSSDQDSDAFSQTAMGRTNWNELSSGDPEAAIAFYTKVFGWHVSGSMAMGAMGDYQFLSLGGLLLGGAMARAEGSPRAGWTFYFRVADVDASAAAIVAGGGAVHHGPVEVPGGDHVVIASDPDGAPFGVVGQRGAPM